MTEPHLNAIEQARQLAESVVIAQNNRFIKELLRQKKLPIGGNKRDFERNLRQAIDGGEITLDDVREWLAEVEGWGDQHVYVHRVPAESFSSRRWSERELRKRAIAVGLGAVWNGDSSLEFPDQMALTAVRFANDSLQFVWHSASDSWNRAPEKDIGPRAEEDSDTYKYQAYRSVGVRNVTRLEIRRDPPLAVAFIPDAWQEVKHAALLMAIRQEAAKIMDLGSHSALPISDAIKALDSRSLDAKQRAQSIGLKARNTRLSGHGGYVEFASVVGTSYSDYLPIRRVRAAVQPHDFVGTTGHFEFKQTAANALTRDVRIQLYGKQDRIRLWVAMTSTDVWTILRLVHETCP